MNFTSPLSAMMVCSLALMGCIGPNDFDLRSSLGSNFGTSDAASTAQAKRPSPNEMGIISYPNYQVAVAKRGDTVKSLSDRLGIDATALAQHNAIAANAPLRAGDVILLPEEMRISTTSDVQITQTDPLPSSALPSQVDVTELAGTALDELEAESTATPTAQAPKPAPRVQQAKDPSSLGFEPIRHKVKRGETAFTISRLYNVTIKALSEWNNLDANLTIREGQFLLVPLPVDQAPRPTKAEAPGQSVTPVPPSAAAPLPVDEDPALSTPAPTQTATAPAPAEPPKASNAAKMLQPTRGSIVVDFGQSGNEGIDIGGAVGASVVAADAGRIAAVTKDSDQVTIIVIKHANNLLTVYANVEDVAVDKGDSVAKGQIIGVVAEANNSQLHFEVRDGFDALDPKDFIQ